ncbi:MAG: RNA methyltransferase [Defluviitaleaceae bacterium]|nr:RNA methyltransferase [Defluviitaleaceae bacterium]
MDSVNPKQVKSLKTKKGRDALNLFIVEGEKLVKEIPSQWQVVTYVYAESKPPTVSHKPILTVSDKYFSALSDTVTPQGVLAVCKKRNFAITDILPNPANPPNPPNPPKNIFLLLLENIADPGNLGTLIRTATAAGANGIILSTGSCDVYNPKTIRAAAGAVLRVPIVDNADFAEVIPYLQQCGVSVLAAHLHGEVLPYQINLRNPCGILIGNEASGLSQNAVKLANITVKLPMANNVESLNAATAGGILLYEVVRQRM